MSTPSIEIRPVNLRSATPEEYVGLNALRNAMRLEILPEDPPWPSSEDMHRLQAMPAIVENIAWAACEESQDRIVALGRADIYHTGDNPLLIWFNIEVLLQYRRQGLARRLLRLIVHHAGIKNRNLLMAECNDRVPAGAAFLSRLGATKGLEEPINQLRLAELDRALVQGWLQRQPELSSEFALGLWDGPYPDDQLDDLAGLMQVVANDQPRDALQMEDINYTPDLFRQFDAEQRAGGDQRWTLYLVHRESGCLAGLTEVFWNPNRPLLLWQGFTGVMPEYRNRGLGRWLKAMMLAKIQRERPQVQAIRAGNANSNAPMLKINHALGFRQYVAWATWQVDLDSVQRYLSASG